MASIRELKGLSLEFSLKMPAHINHKIDSFRCLLPEQKLTLPLTEGFEVADLLSMLIF